MREAVVSAVRSVDARYPLPPGAGTDAVHTNSEYCMALTRLHASSGLAGTGIALTLGGGNRVVCELIDLLAPSLAGLEIESMMGDFGATMRRLADDPTLRWLGPHKGAVHLALASVGNACFDLWAKQREVPLWKLLLDLKPQDVVKLLDLSYVEDALSEEEVLKILEENVAGREERLAGLKDGYPGYDTSVGWMAYDDAKVRDLTMQARDKGFSAFKLKVGSADSGRDLRRAEMLREVAGAQATIMFDANQKWGLAEADRMCRALARFEPLWIEEPTHPDDIAAHVALARAVAPVKIAAGEHVPNRVLFKNFMQAGGMHFVQADCTRLAGVSEFLTVSFLARKLGLPIVPHVGDMGQIHQHLVIFNHVAMNHPVHFLEHIPHLKSYFTDPAQVGDGVYRRPERPGASTDMLLADGSRVD